MVKTITLTSVRGNKIPVSCYGSIRFQSGYGEIIDANEYSFEALQYILDEIQEAQKNSFDRTILLTGDERDGKSTLAAWMATRLGLSNPRDVAFSSSHYLRLLRNAKDNDVAWFDEAARGLYSRDAMTRLNKDLTKAFTQVGIKKLVSIICLPHKALLDIHLRERRIHYWGSVRTRGYRRGLVKWRIAGKNRREPDEFPVPKHENEWEIETYWEPLFAMHFPKFDEFNGFKWDDYDAIKRESLDEFFEGTEVERAPMRVVPNLTRAIHSLKGDGRTLAEIAQRTGLSEQSVYRYLRKKLPLSTNPA